jgi:LuxR family maltose regulon positive regulatory protein
MPDPGCEVARQQLPRTKFTVPDPPVHLVSRPRLRSVLDRTRTATAALICAPAGFGKTMLLADWARGDAGIAWVSVDPDDNDDRRFWSAVLAALATCPAVPTDSPLRTLSVPALPSADAAFLAEVVDALDELAEPVLLVLDDVHEITDPEPLHGLRTLLRHQLGGLRLVLSSRHDPPLPLARLRLADQLVEVRAEDLKLSPQEVKALFRSSGAAVSPAALDRLTEQTDGWAVGARLAAASAARHGDLDEFAAGQDRALGEYLSSEVISSLPGELGEFLHSISVCERVSAGLARTLSGRTDAGAMLHELARRSLVIPRPEEGGEFRLPGLLRSYLLADLGRREPDLVVALHCRAADWFAGEDRPAAALDHCVRTRDSARIGSLLRRFAVTLFLSGHHTVLRRALAVLDERVVAADTLLSLVVAWLSVETGETGIAGLHLAHADATWPDRPRAELESLRQLVHARRTEVDGSTAEIVAAADRIDTCLARTAGLDALATLHRTTTRFAAEPGPDAREHLSAVLDAAARRGQEHVVTRCLNALSELAGIGGDYRMMRACAERADTTASGEGRTIEGAKTCLLLAYGAILQADPAECVRQATRVSRMFEDAPPKMAGNVCLVAEALRGAAEFVLGEWQPGIRRMRTARSAMATDRLAPAHAALCAALEHRNALSLGATEETREVLAWAQETLGDRGEVLLMRARVQLVLGRRTSAGNVLRPVLRGEVPTVLRWSAIEAFLVAVQASGNTADERAGRPLDEALARAESTGAWYPFVFAPHEVIATLTARMGRLGAHERFAGRLLTLRRALRPPPVPAPLTERERSVLRLLPTLRSIDEIAEDLTVSPNTVKTHIRGIYAKLAVRRRRDAVAIALRQGLLDADVTDFGD